LVFISVSHDKVDVGHPCVIFEFLLRWRIRFRSIGLLAIGVLDYFSWVSGISETASAMLPFWDR
jgi:hypothetical protein